MSTSTDIQALLLAEVIASPGDDAPRLIFADWLQDHGQEKRAEHIRIQIELANVPDCMHPGFQASACVWCNRRDDLRRREREMLDDHWHEWIPAVDGLAVYHHHEHGWVQKRTGQDGVFCPVTFRRGFVASVKLPLATWCGETCDAELCVRGRVTTERGEGFDCSVCHGTGHTPGHGAALVRAAPLERVELSDREPDTNHLRSGWYDADSPQREASDCSHHLPGYLFKHLPGGHRVGNRDPLRDYPLRDYPTQQNALSALSTALLTWANAAADLADVRTELTAIHADPGHRHLTEAGLHRFLARYRPDQCLRYDDLRRRERDLAAIVEGRT